MFNINKDPNNIKIIKTYVGKIQVDDLDKYQFSVEILNNSILSIDINADELSKENYNKIRNLISFEVNSLIDNDYFN